MIITITPSPEETDPSGFIEDAAAIARAVEQVGALRGWRVSFVQVYDHLEGATAIIPTPNPRDYDDEDAYEEAKNV